MIFASILPPNEAWLAKAEPEPAINPTLPIVDAHLHLWNVSGTDYFLPEYTRDLQSSGHTIEASVYVECFMHYRLSGPEHLKPVGETEHAVAQADMAAAAGTNSAVASAIIGFADLTQAEATQEALQAHIAAGAGRFRGVRQRAKWDADPAVKGHYSADRPHLYLDPEFGRGIERLSALGLVFEASVYHPQMMDVVQLARAHPEVTIVLNHTGSPVGHSSYAGREAENYVCWLNSIRALGQCPNVYMKLGGMLMNLANFDPTVAERPPTSLELAQLWRPWLEPCIEQLGAGRCMVSSNFPVDRAGFSYRTVWNMFKHIAKDCSATEQAQLFSGTAKRVYSML